MTMKIEQMNFKDFKNRTITQENYADGIVLLGAGGLLEEWINGVSNVLKEENITNTDNPEILFTHFVELKTSGGRTDLVLLFNNETNFNMGKMAMWRLAFGDCCWISDYFDIYASQHDNSNVSESLDENESDDEFDDTYDFEIREDDEDQCLDCGHSMSESKEDGGCTCEDYSDDEDLEDK